MVIFMNIMLFSKNTNTEKFQNPRTTPPGRTEKKEKQAGAEVCQVQDQDGLTAEAELALMLSSMEAVFHLFKIVSDSTRVDLKMCC
jgi:hypothetical protein